MPSPRPLLTSCHISYTNSSTTSEGTSVSQPAGLGSTTAHFFHSLGSFAVRRIDAHIVNRRLLDIQTRFPHRNHEFIPDDDYNVLIEVSRPGMSYDGFSRHRALQVLSLQIGREQVAQLTRQLLITWQQEWHKISGELTMLLRELWKECPLPNLCREFRLGLQCMPLSILSYRYSPHMRREAWNYLGPGFIQKRLTSLTLEINLPRESRNEIFDACFDILGFSSSNDNLSILAIDCLVRIIKSGKGLWWETLSDVLAENTYQDLSDVVDLMLNDSPQYREYSSSLSLGQTPTIFPQSPASGFSIQDCFINLILHSIASNPSFKNTLLNTPFCSLFLRHISRYLHPPTSMRMDIDLSQSHQTVEDLLSAIAGGNTLYHFSGNTMPRVRKIWEKVLCIFGQCPEVYMPVKPAWFMVSHERCHISSSPEAKSQPSRLIQSPSSVPSKLTSEQSRLEAERKSNQTKQSARREDFLRIASSLGLLPEMSHTDSILKEGSKAEVPRSSRVFQPRKRESDFFHVAGELGLMLPLKRS